jgi:hypothetical protein
MFTKNTIIDKKKAGTKINNQRKITKIKIN